MSDFKAHNFHRQRTYITIASAKSIDNMGWFGRLKVHLWNFILPPHIRLSDGKNTDA